MMNNTVNNAVFPGGIESFDEFVDNFVESPLHPAGTGFKCYRNFNVLFCKKAINPTQPAIAIIISEPIILIAEKRLNTVIALAITQVMSIAIIILVALLEIGFFNAVIRTNVAKAIRKMPASANGAIAFVLNNVAKKPGAVANKIPVSPELIALINNTFFSVMIFYLLFFQNYRDDAHAR